MNLLLGELIERIPILKTCRHQISEAFHLLSACFERDNTLFVCGNGGSASDADHIVTELMKSFVMPRPLPETERHQIGDIKLADKLEGALRTFALPAQNGLITAIGNDIGADMIFAQQVYGYGRKQDVLWCLSTSGNSLNVLHALMVARAMGLNTLGLTGAEGGSMVAHCDVCICVPETVTHKIQELHIPIYHALCAMLENKFFSDKPREH